MLSDPNWQCLWLACPKVVFMTFDFPSSSDTHILHSFPINEGVRCFLSLQTPYWAWLGSLPLRSPTDVVSLELQRKSGDTNASCGIQASQRDMWSSARAFITIFPYCFSIKVTYQYRSPWWDIGINFRHKGEVSARTVEQCRNNNSSERGGFEASKQIMQGIRETFQICFLGIYKQDV